MDIKKKLILGSIVIGAGVVLDHLKKHAETEHLAHEIKELTPEQTRLLMKKLGFIEVEQADEPEPSPVKEGEEKVRNTISSGIAKAQSGIKPYFKMCVKDFADGQAGCPVKKSDDDNREAKTILKLDPDDRVATHDILQYVEPELQKLSHPRDLMVKGLVFNAVKVAKLCFGDKATAFDVIDLITNHDDKGLEILEKVEKSSTDTPDFVRNLEHKAVIEYFMTYYASADTTDEHSLWNVTADIRESLAKQFTQQPGVYNLEDVINDIFNGIKRAK